MNKIAFYLLFAVAFAGSAFAQQAIQDTCLLKGRVKIVEDYPDFTVKIVEDYPDLEVEVVEFYVGNECGRIQFVTEYPKVTIKIVNDYPDITIRFKDSKSRELFFKHLNKEL